MPHPESSLVSILLVDDHSIIRAGYRQILQKNPSLQVVAEAESGQCALKAYQRHQPNIVLMDLSIPLRQGEGEVSSACGLDTIRRLVSQDSEARVLVLTALNSEPYPSQAIAAGAKGYLTKHCAPDELLVAVASLMKGETYVSRSVLAMMDGCSESTSKIDRLSQREQEVFCMLAQSYPIAKIADTLHLSPKTVHAHRANILRKLELKTNSDLVRLAMRYGMLET
ncbi:response regulator [Nitrincola tapanii]|uniref:Response regulator transcription factor n=1 Tax=Nitrincola tapanii TaxID=1708751 RepID=A0A5A9W3Y9_9GAMM|nr:response regulator transcription factor [Nitrincola tapanii]KAA0875427.1 response regulator transcription factor [Nitrincola tapanii]